MKTLRLAAGIGLLVTLAVTGCADVRAVLPSPTSSASPTNTATGNPTPSATLPLEMTAAQAKAAYKNIAKASCNWAQRDGVVESGDAYTAVMTNSSQAYLGFTEASFVAPDSYKVLSDLSDFYACADWYAFSMADEAGKTAPIDVTFNSDASFNVHKVLASGEASVLKIVVSNGVISVVTKLDSTDGWARQIRYGSLTDADLQILKKAVDRQIESR
jgi:hypothetical protein